MQNSFKNQSILLLALLLGLSACGGSGSSDSSNSTSTSPLEASGPNPSIPGLTAQYYMLSDPNSEAAHYFALVRLNPVAGLNCSYDRDYSTVVGLDDSKYTIIESNNLTTLKVFCADSQGVVTQYPLLLLENDLITSDHSFDFSFSSTAEGQKISTPENPRFGTEALLIQYSPDSLPVLLTQLEQQMGIAFKLNRPVTIYSKFQLIVKRIDEELATCRIAIFSDGYSDI